MAVASCLRLALRIVLPLLTVAVCLSIMTALIESYEEPVLEPPEVVPPSVRVISVEPSNVRLSVKAEGVVAPRTESRLVSEVTGRVVEISPSLAVGGFFAEGDVLARIDTREYELALVRARAAVGQGKLRLATEEHEAAIAREEWESVGQGEPSPFLFREPQIAEARTSIASAEASLERAQYDLERTTLVAPFSGRVRVKNVDVGQFIQRGASVATLYSVNVAEVRLPIPNSELAYCSLPLAYRDASASAAGPSVKLTADFAGQEHVWRGTIVRTEGEIDPRTGMVNAIAQVKDPYARDAASSRPPLAVGMFVRAEISGNLARNVVQVPRFAMNTTDTLSIVDDQDRLRFRRVEVFRRDGDAVLVSGGLEAGDRIVITAVEAAVDGMKVSPYEQPADTISQ